MTITIGGASLPTRKPKDLDERLISATGCNAAETAVALGGFPIAGRVEAALRPFLGEEAPSSVELAASIYEEMGKDGSTIVADVLALYASTDAAAPASGGKAQ